MRRQVLVALGGVIAFFAAAMGAVVYLDSAERRGPGETPAGATEAPPPPGDTLRPPVLPPRGDGQGAPPALPPGPASLGGKPAMTPRVGEWDQVPPVPAERVPGFTGALEQARPRLAPCYDPDVQARYGGRAYSAIGSAQPGQGGAVVIVQLEANGQGRVRVVDAPVQYRGAVEDGLLSCFQEQVRGLELKGQAAPGSRYRVRYTLAPMIQGLPQVPAHQQRYRLKKP